MKIFSILSVLFLLNNGCFALKSRSRQLDEESPVKRNMLQTTKMSRAKNKHLAKQGRGRNLNIFEHGIANFSGLGIRGKDLSHSKSDSSSGDIDEDTFILLALFAFMFYFFSTFFAGTSIYPTHNPTEYPSLNPSISKVPSLNPSEVPSVTPSPTGVSII